MTRSPESRPPMIKPTLPQPTPPARMMDHALAYAAHGWRVFPCRPRGKEPLTEHSWQDATAAATQIRAWWTRWPTANIGGVPGSIGAAALDFDPHAEGYAGEALLTRLLALNGAHATTAGGGTHMLLRLPAGVTLSNAPG